METNQNTERVFFFFLEWPQIYPLIIDSEACPDLALCSTDNTQVDTVTGVRTADTTSPKEGTSAAARAGAAADTPGMPKNKKWLPLTFSQNTRFMQLVIESSGRLGLGDAALDFIERLPHSAGGSPSDRAAFTTHVLQRFRALTAKGSAAVILARPSSRGAPGDIPLLVALTLAASVPGAPLGLFVAKLPPFSHLHLLG